MSIPVSSRRGLPLTDFFSERRGGDVNFAFHALALLTLTARGVEHASGNATLATKLEAAKGIKLDQTTINRQNNQLQGWSWIAGTFSWVEPTAWALLALKKRAAAGQRIDSARLSEAEALLVDRCCEDGGWNYGNGNMLGKELRPYVPTTAVALLALQKTEQPAAGVVEKSLAYLDRAASSEPSAVALSLSVMALRAHAHRGRRRPCAARHPFGPGNRSRAPARRRDGALCPAGGKGRCLRALTISSPATD